jgi:hypothetical protein
MFQDQAKVISYKWDPASETGYRLRFDPQLAQLSGQTPFRVEDWVHHIVNNEWGCATLDQALSVLSDLFNLDVSEERRRIQGWLPQTLQ